MGGQGEGLGAGLSARSRPWGWIFSRSIPVLTRVQSRVCPGPGPSPPSHWLWPLTLAPIHTPAIEDEYSGPKLEDGRVTVAFMKELMQWYKDQKKLHRKCAYQVTRL